MTITGSIAVRCIAHIVAARIAELEGVLRGRPDRLAPPKAEAGRQRMLADLRHWLRRLGELLKHKADPDYPPLEDVPADVLGALCALAAGEQGQRRPLRDVGRGTALAVLEILDSRA